ncbi:unnamed protein product [Protopolystoma xenopodis]|uniref:Uncharacterized protein n=1 Tax=Protopolystoma xenopodis TaxID=117903 RepID=A0A448WYA9_9PLAT|nr:unnamed protein product [Protopolystoma xenopodis]
MIAVSPRRRLAQVSQRGVKQLRLAGSNLRDSIHLLFIFSASTSTRLCMFSKTVYLFLHRFGSPSISNQIYLPPSILALLLLGLS